MTQEDQGQTETVMDGPDLIEVGESKAHQQVQAVLKRRRGRPKGSGKASFKFNPPPGFDDLSPKTQAEMIGGARKLWEKKLGRS